MSNVGHKMAQYEIGGLVKEACGQEFQQDKGWIPNLPKWCLKYRVELLMINTQS